MIKKDVKHWNNVTSLEGLLFFAQRLNEMLFDYTIDTYKPMVLNTAILCDEAILVINLINKNLIDKQNLAPIIAELNWSMSHDLVARDLLKDYENLYLPIKDQSNTDDVLIKLELIKNRLTMVSYFSKCQELLIQSISNNEKKKISRLGSNLITSLKAFGYSQNFLYLKVNDFFFNNSKPINDTNQLVAFFEIFPIKNGNEYFVYFTASNIFKEIKDSLKTFSIEITDKLPTTHSPLLKSLIKGPQEVFIICKVVAPDYIKARIKAEKKIDSIANFFVFFHHKEKPKCKPDAMVIEPTTGLSFTCPLPTSPMKKGFDLTPQKAASRFQKVLKNLMLHPESFERFDNALRLHSIAVDNSNIHNQILGLWIAFETLVPNSENKGKLHQVIDTLLPILKLRYMRYILDNISNDISRWNRTEILKILKKITVGNSASEKLHALVLCKDYEPFRQELYLKLNDFPLLRNRLFELNASLNSGQKMLTFIGLHETKLDWQIRRIYRVRNLVVHSGKAGSNADLLVENAHTYLDHFINQLIEFSIDNGRIKTIEQGIKEAALLWQKKETYLKAHSNDDITSVNYLNFIT